MPYSSPPHRQEFGRGFVIGIAATVIIMALIGLLVMFGGLYNVAADKPHTAVGRAMLSTTMDNSVRHHAGGLKAPAMDAAAIREGGSEYKEMCAGCHGGPGVEPMEATRGMLPRPPSLAEAADEWETPEIFWLVKHGVKMSAMPAFGSTHNDATLWKIAAFVKSLPKTKPADYAAIQADNDEAHHHGDKDQHGE
jgi:mono/diheme cytochrome c family protein